MLRPNGSILSFGVVAHCARCIVQPGVHTVYGYVGRVCGSCYQELLEEAYR